MKQKLKIFGANLRDQSKGQFVVHAHDCADCAKLHRLDENWCEEEHGSALSVAESIFSDMIDEGSMTAVEGLQEIHFCPCVKFSEPLEQNPVFQAAARAAAIDPLLCGALAVLEAIDKLPIELRTLPAPTVEALRAVVKLAQERGLLVRTEPQFTTGQIANWRAYEKVRKGGKWNMFEQAREALAKIGGAK